MAVALCSCSLQNKENVFEGFRFIPDYLKTQKMCKKAVEKDPYQLGDFPDHLKTQEMCKKSR